MPSSSAALQKDLKDAWSFSGNVDTTKDPDARDVSVETPHTDSSDLHLIMSDAPPAPADSSDGYSMPCGQQEGISEDADSKLPAETAAPPLTLMRPKPTRRIAAPEAPAEKSPQASLKFAAAGESAHWRNGAHQGLSNSRQGLSAATATAGRDGTSPQHARGAQQPQAAPVGIQKRQPAVIPHVAALGALVGALARASDLDEALQLYKQVCCLAS